MHRLDESSRIRRRSGTASIMSSWIECREMEWKNGGYGWVVILNSSSLPSRKSSAGWATMPPPMETVRRGARWNPVHCHVAEDHVRSHTPGALRGNNKGVKFRNERQSVGFIVRKRTGSSSGGTPFRFSHPWPRSEDVPSSRIPRSVATLISGSVVWESRGMRFQALAR